MPGKVTFDTVLDALVLLIPVAVAFTLFALLLAKRRPRRNASEVALAVAKEPVYPIAQPVAADTAIAATPLAPKPIESPDVIMAKIETAMTDGPKTSLSSLYLDLAAAHERAGDVSAQMSALRSAAGCGALHGPPTAHAAARMALGEVAYRAGDLTSACEQWQLARTAFLEGGDAEQHARVEKRMRENGCPTDWVLTDF